MITGANRGICKGLLEAFIARPQTTVSAAVRAVAKSTIALKSVAVGTDSKLVIVKVDSASETDPVAAVSELESKHHISKIDVIIANAGIQHDNAPTLKTPVKDVRTHFEINTIGPLNLIQAFYPLLEKSEESRFLVVSSSLGSMGSMESHPVPFVGYGLSKAATNNITRKLHFENPKLTSVAFCPGWVQTDMGNDSAQKVGMTQAPRSLEDSIVALMRLIDAANRDNSGTFTSITGESVPW